MEIDIILEALLKEGYPPNESTRTTAYRLSSLEGIPKQMLDNWIRNGEKPSFEPINGVSSQYLSEVLQMKTPAIILAYQMLLDSPQENARYFKGLNITGRINQNLFKKFTKISD